MINHTKLRYMVAVDRQGSVTAAALALNVTQSAVTKCLADIERDVGFAVFERRATGMAATAEGRRFIDRAARIVADLDQLISDARSDRDSRDLVLRLCIVPASLEGLMNRAVRMMLEQNPKLRIQMHGSNVEHGLQQLQHGDVDAIIAPYEPLSSARRLALVTLPDLASCLFARVGHPLARSDAQPSTTEIGRYPIIAPDLSGPHMDPLFRILATFGGDANRDLHILENFPMVAHVVSTTDAIGVVSRAYTTTATFQRRFRALNFDLGPPMPMAIAHRSEWLPSRAMSLLLAAVKRHPPTGGATN
jgi:LysR family transcriptional regulator, regulator of abg operon